VSTVPPIELIVYPDDCDAFGHVNQAAYFRLFERARWEALGHGPGLGVFRAHGAWPAVRKTEAEFFQQLVPGDRVRFELEVEHWGETSFTVRQQARKVGAQGLAADVRVVLVTIGRDGRPCPVPAEVGRALGVQTPRRTGASQQFTVRDLVVTVDVTGDGPAALLDAVKVDQAVVCGFSMGGYVAFELLRRHRNRIRALVLANTRAGADDADGRASRDAMIARIRRDGPGFLADEMIPRLLAPTSLKTQPDVVRRARGMVAGQQADGLVGALTAMRDRADATALLSTIAIPTLVIAGSDVQLIPSAASRAMAEAVPNAHFAMIPGAGHLAPMEQAVNTARVIREFLEALL
jgi:3-oxoadipate enol-lactonase